MTRLVIVRHGNTFTSKETPRRIGARTDIPLVETGRQQAKALGGYVAQQEWSPEVVYTSPLKRAQETAALICAYAGINEQPQISEIFTEIDHGPDENKPEEVVVQRIGQEALQRWDRDGVVPQDWQVDPQQIVHNWQSFADEMLRRYPQQTVMVVTSGGTARFALYLTENYAATVQNSGIKLSTGAFGMLCCTNHQWIVESWNKRP